MFRVLKVDNSERASRIVGEVYVVPIHVSAVYAAADRRRVFGKNFQMAGIGSVQKNDPVFSIGSSLAGEHANFFVGRGADVVNQAGIDFQSVQQFGVGGIGDIVDEKLSATVER